MSVIIAYKLPKYHTDMLGGDLSAKVGREDIFKPACAVSNVITTTPTLNQASFIPTSPTAHVVYS
jgi:hypothetical protein